MNIPNWLNSYINSEGLQNIETAVKEAEKKTSGEIVPMVVRKSSTIGHIPMMIFFILLSLYYISGGYDLAHESLDEPWIITLAWSVISIVLSVSLSRSMLIQRTFVNRIDRATQSQTRALNEFYQAGLDQTKDSTGILLFVSLMDHQAVVLADKGISSKYPASQWEEVVNLLLKGAREKKMADGFSKAIDLCGELLKKDFPIQPDDQDELKNHLIIKD